MTIQPQKNNLNYLIDPTFTNVNRLFVLSFSRNNNTDNRDSFSDYYVPNLEIKDFNVLIDGKRFFDLPVKYEVSRQTKLKDPQQINFVGKLDKDNGATMFFIIEKSEETAFNFSQNSATII